MHRFFRNLAKPRRIAERHCFCQCHNCAISQIQGLSFFIAQVHRGNRWAATRRAPCAENCEPASRGRRIAFEVVPRYSRGGARELNNPETGAVTLDRHLAIDDYGRLMSFTSTAIK